jgi:hypothetical protein
LNAQNTSMRDRRAWLLVVISARTGGGGEMRWGLYAAALSPS